MPHYEFQCADCGSFVRPYSMASVPSGPIPCPTCQAPARRLLGGSLIGGPTPQRRLLDATAATADRPAVVSAPPATGVRRTQPVSADPRHQRLPRP